MVDEGDGVSREQGWRTATVRTQEMEDERGRRVIDLVDLVNWGGRDEVGPIYRIRCGGCIQASPYPSKMWAGFEGCQTTWTYRTGLRGAGWVAFLQLVTDRAVCPVNVWGPAVDGLTHLTSITRHL